MWDARNGVKRCRGVLQAIECIGEHQRTSDLFGVAERLSAILVVLCRAMRPTVGQRSTGVDHDGRGSAGFMESRSISHQEPLHRGPDCGRVSVKCLIRSGKILLPLTQSANQVRWRASIAV